MIPSRMPSGRTIGTPLIAKRAMSRWASLSEASGPSVMGLRIMPLSERLTRSTSWAWRSTGMFLWMTPTPPLPGHRDRHAGLGDRVHGGGYEGDLERDAVGQPGRDVGVPGVHQGMPGDQEDIVEG